MNDNATTVQEPIAIVGFSFRLPGGANTPDRLWQILEGGEQSWTDVPGDRYNWKAFNHPDPDARGTHNARGGFFIKDDIAAFDAKFFGIPDAEAASIDPQQRLLLEVSYEALENAGMPVEGLRGSQTGVYVALVSRDYDRQLYKDSSDLPKYHLTGCGDATACGRISYTFDFRGPSMSIDTGCSGGLVGVHLACQALRLGESTMALVGGTNLLLGPDMTMAMSNLHMVNEDGRCYPFDSRGSGYGRAEGVAVTVLKRLSDAKRDGDAIRAIILGSGVGQDGKTNGILLPSSEAQRELASSLYKRNLLDPQQTAYVEMHGTGTAAGDTSEISSIRDVFVGDGSRRSAPLTVGSVKANLGHSESTSGLSGVLSAVLAMEKGMIPPIAALQDLKADVKQAVGDGCIQIPRRVRSWPQNSLRQASVNSFGFGGTNAHIILQGNTKTSEMPRISGSSTENGSYAYTNGVNGTHQIHSTTSIQPLASDLKSSNGSDHSPGSDSTQREKWTTQLFCFSAKSEASLSAVVEKYRAWAECREFSPSTFSNLARTLAHRRSTLTWRSSVAAKSKDELLSALQRPRCVRASGASRPVFLFTGQGAQYARMGKELLAMESAFAHSLISSDAILRTLGASWSLVEEIQQAASHTQINSSRLSQPATTAVQIAIVDHLRDKGIFPTAVLGHSSGEVAAAYSAGILTHEDALRISYHKGFVADWCRETSDSKGAMLAVGLGEEDASRHLSELVCQGQASVACVNSPSSVTVSGDEEAVEELQRNLDRDSIFNRRLKVDIAYHSHHMEGVSPMFYRSMEDVRASTPYDDVKFFSSVTCTQRNDPLGRKYWVQNLTSKVCFSDALRQLLATAGTVDHTTLLVEIGPHSALEGPVRQIVAGLGTSSRCQYIPSLVRNKDSEKSMVELAGQLWEHGAHTSTQKSDVLESNANKSGFEPFRDLPTYAWDHSKRHWHESRLSKDYRFRRYAPHDLLGLRVIGTSPQEPIYRLRLSVDDLPWLQEHMIDGFALYPGSAFLVHALEGVKQMIETRGEPRRVARYHFKDVKFTKSIVVPDAPGHVEILVNLKPAYSNVSRLGVWWMEFRISSESSTGTWNDNCHGSIGYELESEPPFAHTLADVGTASERLGDIRRMCNASISSDNLYENLRRNGVDYGPNFTIVKELQLSEATAVGKVEVPDIAKCMPRGHLLPHVIHPATYDAFMHIALPLYHRSCSEGPVMLTSIGEATISADIFNQPGDTFTVICDMTDRRTKSGTVDVAVLQQDTAGDMVEVATLHNEQFTSIGESNTMSKATDTTDHVIYHMQWTESNTPQAVGVDQPQTLVPRLKEHTPSNRWLKASSGADVEDELKQFHSNITLNLEFGVTGLMSSGRFIPQKNMEADLAPEEVQVRIYAQAINGEDVSVAQGNRSAAQAILGEFAGEVLSAGTETTLRTGDRVCGWGANAVTNIAKVPGGSLHRIADDVSFSEGAAMPLAFATAYHSLVNVGRLVEGQQVLVHDAASAMGQAAIAIARALKAQVFATIATESELAIVTDYLGVPRDRVFSNRTTAFQRLLKDIEIIVHCTEAVPVDASIACVADLGVIVQIASKASSLVVPSCSTNVSIISIDMLSMREKRPQLSERIFAEAMAFCSSAKVLPPSQVAIPITDFEKAFRMVKSDNYIGKVVVHSNINSLVLQSSSALELREHDPDDLYLVIGENKNLNNAFTRMLKERPSVADLVWVAIDPQAPLKPQIAARGVDSMLQGVRGVITLNLDSLVTTNGDNHTSPCAEIIGELQSRALVDFAITVSQETSMNTAALYAATISKFTDNGTGTAAASHSCLEVGIHVPMLGNVDELDSKSSAGPLQGLLATIEFCMSLNSGVGVPSDLFVVPKSGQGFDRTNPIFEFLPLHTDQGDGTQAQTKDSLEQKIKSAGDLDLVRQLVASAVREQLSAFCAIDSDDIRMDEGIAAAGLDSLLAIEFKNWVVRSLKTPMQTTEILDATSINALVMLISRRFQSVHSNRATHEPLANCGAIPESRPPLTNGYGSEPNPAELPPLPLPKLDDLINGHLAGVRAFASEEEFKHTLGLATAFQAEGGSGARLYARMEAMKKADPENWYHDLFLNNQYLCRKGALAPYMLFFFTHPLSAIQHPQSERAALVAATLIRYKRALEAGQVEPRYLNEQPLCMDLYKNLFNACREPRNGHDAFNKYPGNDYFIVLHRGHAYKVEFKGLNDTDMYERLDNAFSSVLRTSPVQLDWLGVLSADHRVAWAQNYEAFKSDSPQNAAYLQAMQECAFIICLDEASPQTASQRAQQVHFGDGSNRWVDKPINYVVCANGVSGMVADHTGLDAPSVAEISQKIAAAIAAHDPTTARKTQFGVPFTTLNHTGFSALDTNIERMKESYQAIVAKREHFFTSLPFGASFMKMHKIPPNSGFQLIVQLASRLHFGYLPACWETVLQMTYKKGRVEINQVVTVELADFVMAAADDATPPPVCRRKFLEAARKHSGNVLAATRSGGSDRFLSLIREISKDGERDPELYNDPPYQRSRPRKMMSSCFKTHMAENGCVVREDDSIWLHFEVGDESVKFSASGLTGQTDKFVMELQRAAERVKDIITHQEK